MLSLRLDALYCLVVGVAVAASAPALPGAVALPAPAIFIAGLLVVVWAGAVELMRCRLPLAVALWTVMAANFVATVAVAVVSLTAAAVVAALTILAIAVDVSLFAGSQAIALRRIARIAA